MSTKPKLIVILGPTSSGKTGLSIKLAKKFGGEVVSADSRQVYRGMNIGSGKVTKKEMAGVFHHLLDVANPKRRFSVAQYKKLAEKAISKIHKKNKIPFLVGGTGFYIQSVVDGIVIPQVKPDWKLRAKLEKLTVEQMFEKLKKLDPKRAKSIDRYNPRRLVRALEIVMTTGKAVPTITKNKNSELDILQIGITKSQDELKKLIRKRLLKRLENNAMINEVKKLRKTLSWKRLEEFGLEYRFIARLLRYAQHCGQAQYLEAYQEMIDSIQKESEHYVKRQMTWFKKDNRIIWIKNQKEAENLIEKFLK